MTAFESPTRTFVRDTRVPSNINTFVIGGERIFEPFSIFPSIKGPFKNSYKQIVKTYQNISKHPIRLSHWKKATTSRPKESSRSCWCSSVNGSPSKGSQVLWGTTWFFSQVTTCSLNDHVKKVTEDVAVNPSESEHQSLKLLGGVAILPSSHRVASFDQQISTIHYHTIEARGCFCTFIIWSISWRKNQHSRPRLEQSHAAGWGCCCVNVPCTQWNIG